MINFLYFSDFLFLLIHILIISPFLNWVTFVLLNFFRIFPILYIDPWAEECVANISSHSTGYIFIPVIVFFPA